MVPEGATAPSRPLHTRSLYVLAVVGRRLFKSGSEKHTASTNTVSESLLCFIWTDLLTTYREKVAFESMTGFSAASMNLATLTCCSGHAGS